MSVTVEVKGIREITQMFKGLPKQVNKDLVWGRFWKKVTVPLLTAAEGKRSFIKSWKNRKSWSFIQSYKRRKKRGFINFNNCKRNIKKIS